MSANLVEPMERHPANLEAVSKYQFNRSWGGADELLRYSSVAYSSEYASLLEWRSRRAPNL